MTLGYNISANISLLEGRHIWYCGGSDNSIKH